MKDINYVILHRYRLSFFVEVVWPGTIEEGNRLSVAVLFFALFFFNFFLNFSGSKGRDGESPNQN